jgi:putative two-component system response regulator
MTKGNTDKAQVMVVDDEARVREILFRSLTEAGYECTTATNGSSALRKLKDGPIDLVLLDINMPGKSGSKVLKEIKTQYPDTVVIMVTAIADVRTAIDLLTVGAYDYIIKPFDLNVLKVSIRRALDRRRLILENRSYQLHLEEKVKAQTDKIRQSFINSITSLAYALEAKDAYTRGHSDRVTKIAIDIAQKLSLSEDEVEKIRLAGLVHDIGKIGVRESVLNKPDKLTDEEYRHVKAHCEIGERILSPIIEDKVILNMVRHHHEHYDGRGYPDGLLAMQIPQGSQMLSMNEAFDTTLGAEANKGQLVQGARILAVADAYDAMTSNRPYRPAMYHETACAELEKGKGTQFDPAVVDAFLQTVTERGKL